MRHTRRYGELEKRSDIDRYWPSGKLQLTMEPHPILRLIRCFHWLRAVKLTIFMTPDQSSFLKSISIKALSRFGWIAVLFFPVFAWPALSLPACMHKMSHQINNVLSPKWTPCTYAASVIRIKTSKFLEGSFHQFQSLGLGFCWWNFASSALLYVILYQWFYSAHCMFIKMRLISANHDQQDTPRVISTCLSTMKPIFS